MSETTLTDDLEGAWTSTPGFAGGEPPQETDQPIIGKVSAGPGDVGKPDEPPVTPPASEPEKKMTSYVVQQRITVRRQKEDVPVWIDIAGGESNVPAVRVPTAGTANRNAVTKIREQLEIPEGHTFRAIPETSARPLTPRVVEKTLWD